MKEKRKGIHKISNIIFIVVLLLSVIMFGLLFKLAVLPMKYMVLIILAYLLILNLMAFLILPVKVKKVFKIGASVFNGILIVFLVTGILYLLKTLGFLDSLIGSQYKTEEYYVAVLKESRYASINELEDKKISVHNNETEIFQQAVHSLEKKLTFEKIEEKDMASLKIDLLDKKVEAIFISSSHKVMIEEEDIEFYDKLKILTEVSVKIEMEIEKVKNVDVTKNPFHIYISGIDTYGSISSVARSDVNIVVTVNPRTNQILLTSIPRDYYVQLAGTTGYKDKLTHAGIYGIDKSIRTIENLLEINIDYYVRVNFSTLIKLIDSLGGITANSSYAFTSVDRKYTYTKGLNSMDGNKALSFSRERKSFPGGDRTRGENQQKVIEAIIGKMTSSSTLVTKYTNILDSLKGMFQTNFGSEQISKLARMQLDKMPSWTTTSISLDGTDSSNYTYSYGKSKLYVMEPKEETVIAAKNKISEIYNK